MRRFLPVGLGCCVLVALGFAEEVAEEQGASELVEPLRKPQMDVDGRVVSQSRQFGVTGGSSTVRSSLVIEAEEVRRRFNRLMGKGAEEVSIPIEILLRGQAGDPPKPRPVALELRYTSDTYLIRIHVDLARGVDRERLAEELLRSLVFQLALKDAAPGSVDIAMKVPQWLVLGIQEADQWRQGLGERELYDGVFRQGARMTLDELFETGQDEYWQMDGVSRSMFRVLSGAMIMALVEQPDGAASIGPFCAGVPAFDGEMPLLLRRYFPGLNLSEKSLVKWWALTLAKLAEAPITDVMTVLETEKALDDALWVRFRDKEGLIEEVRIEQWDAGMPEGEAVRFQVIRATQDDLNRLSYRCFPSYRPLLVDYQRLLQVVAKDGRDEKVDEAFAELTTLRERMAERATRGRDYLDYMEISTATELSGDFDDYMRLKREMRERPREQRGDSLSRYLDTLEKVYRPSNEENVRGGKR